MIAPYAVTSESTGGQDRAEHAPLLPGALQQKWPDSQTLRAWCQTASAASAVSLLLTLPETRRALQGDLS